MSAERVIELLGQLQAEVGHLTKENHELRARLAKYEAVGSSEVASPDFRRRGSRPSVISRHSLFVALSGHTDGVWDIACSPLVSDELCSASADGTVRLWSVSQHKALSTYARHKGSVNSVRYSSSGTSVCTASGDGSARLLRVRDDTNAVPSNSTPAPPTSEQSRHQRSGSWPNAPSAQSDSLDLNNRLECVTTIDGYPAPVSAAMFCDGDQAVVSGCWDCCVRIHRLHQGESVQSQQGQLLRGHTDRITNVFALPRLPQCLSSSLDGTYRIWDLRQGAACVSNVAAHTGGCQSAVFAPSGDVVATAGDDKNFCIWDVRVTRSPLRSIAVHAGVNRLCFSPSGGLLLAPCDDGVTRAFDNKGRDAFTLESGWTQSKASQPMRCAAAWAHDESAVFSAGWARTVHGWRR